MGSVIQSPLPFIMSSASLVVAAVPTDRQRCPLPGGRCQRVYGLSVVVVRSIG